MESYDTLTPTEYSWICPELEIVLLANWLCWFIYKIKGEKLWKKDLNIMVLWKLWKKDLNIKKELNITNLNIWLTLVMGRTEGRAENGKWMGT